MDYYPINDLPILLQRFVQDLSKTLSHDPPHLQEPILNVIPPLAPSNPFPPPILPSPLPHPSSSSTRSMTYQWILLQRFAQDLSETLSHDPFHLQEPILHVTLWIEGLFERHHLTVTGEHLSNLKIIFKPQLQGASDKNDINMTIF